MSFLEQIYRERRESVRESKSRAPLSTIKSGIAAAEGVRPFEAGLRRDHRAAIIAEIKFRSPSAGLLHERLGTGAIAESYFRAGADALSVLTEPRHFGGDLAFIGQAKARTALPVLRKDFLFDEYQVYESRAAGADAILLIAAMLERNQIVELVQCARELSLGVLLELHDENDLERAHAANGVVLGVNHRNLSDFKIDMSVSSRLFPLLPPGATKVAESGIETAADIERMESIGANAVLVGTALMRAPDPGEALKKLLGA